MQNLEKNFFSNFELREEKLREGKRREEKLSEEKLREEKLREEKLREESLEKIVDFKRRLLDVKKEVSQDR